MNQVRFVSFAQNQEEVFAALLALRSIQLNMKLDDQVLVLVPQPVIDKLGEAYPDLNFSNLMRQLGGQLSTAFAKGYNWNLGFRPAISQIVNKLKEGEAFLYFSPKTVFFSDHVKSLLNDKPWCAKQSDDFWPNRDLYGPSLTDIWSSVVQMGGGKIADWIDLEQPDEYWRRYPTGTTNLFYAPDPQVFSEEFSRVNDLVIKDRPETLEGQGHAPSEAIITATIVALDGQFVHPHWDKDVMFYQDFYELVLRLGDDQSEWLQNQAFDIAAMRRSFKSVDEYKVIFFQSKISRIRDGFDEIERQFLSNRMQLLITRRKIRRGVKKRLKRDAEKAEKNGNA